ncbi:MAG: hypothetical protein K0R38_3557 [Polyangiaceae bacterium]|nr:hypothetical protein [Polyangiaceae bacterium]
MMPQMTSRRPARRAISIASAVPLSGWTRPNTTSESPPTGENGNVRKSTP